MRLISPDGIRVSVADEKGERLKARGWKEPEETPALPVNQPSKPSRRRKTPSA